MWEHSSDEGHLLQPNLSERPKKNLPLLFFEEEEVEKIHARDQKKRALSLVCICLCDETIHSYERKTNGVKRERVLRSPLVLQIYRCVRAYKIPSRNEVLSLLCFWLVVFVLWDEIFFF